jgi:pimeloyl-ACP methyl ester carboxylesterase
MKKRKRRVLIIVHGGWGRWPRNRFLELLRSSLWRWATSERGIMRKDYHQLAEYMKTEYDVVEMLPWNGRVFRKTDIEIAAARLAEYIRKYKNEKLDIIAVSIGGMIVQEAMLMVPEVKVNKILYLGAMHSGHHKIKNASQTFNVYSKIDKMFFIANELYEGMGNAFLNGENVMNLALPEVKHDELVQNIKIKKGSLKNRTLFEFYKILLRSSRIPFAQKALIEFRKI